MPYRWTEWQFHCTCTTNCSCLGQNKYGWTRINCVYKWNQTAINRIISFCSVACWWNWNFLVNFCLFLDNSVAVFCYFWQHYSIACHYFDGDKYRKNCFNSIEVRDIVQTVIFVVGLVHVHIFQYTFSQISGIWVYRLQFQCLKTIHYLFYGRFDTFRRNSNYWN